MQFIVGCAVFYFGFVSGFFVMSCLVVARGN